MKKLISNLVLERFRIFVDNRFYDAKEGDNCRIIVDEHETDLMSFVAGFGEPEYSGYVIDSTFDDLSQSVSDQET